MLSDQELLQIRIVVDKVIEARLLEFSELQLTLISDMLIGMTDKYVESLMQLAKMIRGPQEASRKEAERMVELMLTGLRK